MERLDCIVVGAGVVGLAIARALAIAGREVGVVDAAESIGTVTSARNSEVIHAGIYYPRGSLKARFCVSGKEMLYRYCADRGVPHRRSGKLIVATDDSQVPTLDKIRAQAAANGVGDLRLLSARDANDLEPDLRCTAALLSPSTGIIDSHAYMLALQGEAEANGAVFVFHTPVEAGALRANGIELALGGSEPMRVLARTVVNSAGLHAPAVAASIEGLPQTDIPPAYFAKGNYFALQGKSPFRHLVYPVPEAAGLGVHLTLDLGGQARFGPDVEWVDEIDYNVDPRRSDGFYEAIRNYWPGLRDGALVPAYSGIRPKIQAPDEPAKDFLIRGPADHGVPGLINLFGIESPGLTASPAIAEHVASIASLP